MKNIVSVELFFEYIDYRLPELVKLLETDPLYINNMAQTYTKIQDLIIHGCRCELDPEQFMRYVVFDIKSYEHHYFVNWITNRLDMCIEKLFLVCSNNTCIYVKSPNRTIEQHIGWLLIDGEPNVRESLLSKIEINGLSKRNRAIIKYIIYMISPDDTYSKSNFFKRLVRKQQLKIILNRTILPDDIIKNVLKHC
jgi:hypothetical protein